jgi:hypothetical protein
VTLLGLAQGQAARFPWQPPPGAREVCLAQVRALGDRLFPGGIASTTIVNDRVVESEPSTRRLLGHPRVDWSPVTDWAELLDQVEGLGAGGAGLVVNGRHAGVGHAFTRSVNRHDSPTLIDCATWRRYQHKPLSKRH